MSRLAGWRQDQPSVSQRMIYSLLCRRKAWRQPLIRTTIVSWVQGDWPLPTPWKLAVEVSLKHPPCASSKAVELLAPNWRGLLRIWQITNKTGEFLALTKKKSWRKQGSAAVGGWETSLLLHHHQRHRINGAKHRWRMAPLWWPSRFPLWYCWRCYKQQVVYYLCFNQHFFAHIVTLKVQLLFN